jgi:hypothetical protein
MLSAFLELERIAHELALLALLGDDSNGPMDEGNGPILASVLIIKLT